MLLLASMRKDISRWRVVGSNQIQPLHTNLYYVCAHAKYGQRQAESNFPQSIVITLKDLNCQNDFITIIPFDHTIRYPNNIERVYYYLENSTDFQYLSIVQKIVLRPTDKQKAIFQHGRCVMVATVFAHKSESWLLSISIQYGTISKFPAGIKERLQKYIFLYLYIIRVRNSGF